MHRDTCIKHGRNIKTQCIGLSSNLLRRKDLSSIKHEHSQLIVSRRLSWWKLEERIGFRNCWRKWRLATNPVKNQKNPIVRTGRQPSGSLTQEIDKGVLFGCKSTNVSTVRLVFQLCASVFWTFRSRQRRRRKLGSRSNKHGETC